MSAADRDDAGTGEARAEKPNLLDRLRAVFGGEKASMRDDIEDALEDAAPGADLSTQERVMLRNVLGLHELRVEDVMVPRADIIAVSVEATLAEVLRMFRTAGHSRLPVHGETLDDPRGMIHIRDFVDHVAGEAEANAASDPAARPQARFGRVDLDVALADARILRPVLFVPPSMPALDLLVKMQASRTHMALVIDEYGGTDGLVSIEDIVEMIVGDIEDEHDESERPLIEAAAEGGFIADGRASLEEVGAALGLDLSKSADAEEVDTLGGLITTGAGRVPVRGEILKGPLTLEFEVLDADPRRIKRVRIRRAPPGPCRGRAGRRGATPAGVSPTLDAWEALPSPARSFHGGLTHSG